MLTRMILLEGFQKADKAFLPEIAARCLNTKQKETMMFPETSPIHPLDLTWRACLNHAEYSRLLELYPKQASLVKTYTTEINGHFLVPYKNGIDFGDANLTEYLATKEFCYSQHPALGLADYQNIYYAQWREYARQSAGNTAIGIFDGVFFRHPVHDLLRGYHASNADIITHLVVLLQAVQNLRSAIFYINHNANDFAEYSNAKKDLLLRSKAVEFAAMGQLPLMCFVIDHNGGDWELVSETIAAILNKIA